jgi:hypothetical protein
MSELVSLYDVIFGTRAIKGTEDGSLRVSYDLRNKEEPVDITRVACAVEDESVKSYCFDKFGRFGIATVETKEKAKLFLASYHNILLSNIDPSEAVEYEESLSDVHDTSEWHYFGWMADELPDFEACYKKWKLENNPSGKEPNLNPAHSGKPRSNNSIWRMAEGLIRMVIHQELLAKSQSIDEYVAELMSKKNSKDTMILLDTLERLAPGSFDIDETTFRKQLKYILRS